MQGAGSLTYPRIRVGAVSYLNTKPLVFQLEQLAPQIELRYDLPSRLATRLAEGELDVALIPSIEVLGNPSYRVVSNACIACRGPVLSVKLLSRVPVSRIRTLALDEGSRTSAALVRILLREQHGLTPMLVPLPLAVAPEHVPADAVLVIGDRAIHTPAGMFHEEWDLGERWYQWYGLPFVFAMWTARAGVDSTELATAFEAARDAGVAHLREIARHEAPLVRLDAEVCWRYLRDNLHFLLGAREQRGLELFRAHAERLGLVPAASSEWRMRTDERAAAV